MKCRLDGVMYRGKIHVYLGADTERQIIDGRLTGGTPEEVAQTLQGVARMLASMGGNAQIAASRHNRLSHIQSC